MLIALIFAFYPDLLKWGTGFHEESKKESAHKKIRAQKLETYRNNGPGLIAGLQDLCHRKTTLVLLIDNAHVLKPADRELLEKFANRGFASRTQVDYNISRFQAAVRVLVVTLDFSHSKSERHASIRKVLPVAPFTRVELRQILEHSNPSGVSGNSREWMLDMAEQNVKAVYLEQNSKLRLRLEKEFKDHPNAFEDIFDFNDLMAFCAVRPLLDQSPAPTTGRLLKLLNNLDPAAFGLRKPQDVENLVKEFCSTPSSLFRIEGVVIHFDAAACKILRKALEEDNAERPYLLRAHYYWFNELIRPFDLTVIPSHRSFSDEDQVKIRQAAWHARKLGVLISKKPVPDDDQPSETPNLEPEVVDSALLTEFFATTRLDEVEQLKFRHQAAAALLLSSVFNRSEGEIEQSRKLVEDALAWLPAGTAAEPAWISFAARLLWSSYWISLDIGIRAQLEIVARNYPSMTADPIWLVNQQFENLLKGDMNSSAVTSAPPISDPDQLNLWSLTGLLRTIRLSHGFTGEGLCDPAISVPEPLPGEDLPWVEFTLRNLQAYALIYRENWEKVEQALASIRELLRAGPGLGEPIHLQVNRLYQSGRYHHLLLECWNIRNEAIEDLPAEEQEQKRQELENWLNERSNATSRYGYSARETLFDKAQLDYRSAMQIAAWLNFHSILLEAGFDLGCLLFDFTSEDTKADDAAWWNEWDRLFQGCLRIEKQSGWQLHAPEIYRLQSEFFGREDKSAAISDSFNTLQAVKKAGYPDDVVLEWHTNTRQLLTKYAQNEDDYRRSAELHELWARELAALPQALAFRNYKHSLSLEQAYHLDFAAQSERQAGDLKRAEVLNIEADRLCREALAGEHGEDDDTVRDLSIGIRMEHAWIVRSDSNRQAEYYGLMRGIWKDLERGCEHCANVLGCMVTNEDEEGVLDTPWPSSAGIAAMIDPENEQFSLPERWFRGSDALRVINRAQFRFFQMLSLVSDAHDPSVEMLMSLGSRSGWRGQEQFGESVMKIARIELEHGYFNKRETEAWLHEATSGRATLIRLLEAVARAFFADADAENQIESYRFLLQFEPENQRFRVAYVRALAKHRQFLDRELRARALERADWLATARRLDYYFNILVDNGMFTKRLAEQIRYSGQSAEAFNSALEQLAKTVPRAKSHFMDGRYKECQAILDPVLNFVPNSWIFILHLEALDLWLRSATRLNQNIHPTPAGIETYNRRAAQLREMSLRYITQFGLTIDDPIIQQLAVQLFETLRDAVPGGKEIAGLLPAMAT